MSAWVVILLGVFYLARKSAQASRMMRNQPSFTAYW